MKKTNEDMPEKEKQKEPSTARELLEYLVIIAVVAVVLLLVNSFLIINARIPSASMENTVMPGDRIFGNRLAYTKEDPERYDIVIFRYPDDESELFIKRIIGLPGETVEIVDGKVYINGSEEPLNDSFCPETPVGSFGPYVVPEGCYFVLGDNRNNSRDSRYWENTYVTREEILGEAVFRYWPLTSIGKVG